jgi:hypothetical protein
MSAGRRTCSSGLYYRLRSSAEIDWTLQRNIQYLEDYWRFDAVGVASEIRKVVASEVAVDGGLSSRVRCAQQETAKLRAAHSRFCAESQFHRSAASPIALAISFEFVGKMSRPLSSHMVAVPAVPERADARA